MGRNITIFEHPIDDVETKDNSDYGYKNDFKEDIRSGDFSLNLRNRTLTYKGNNGIIIKHKLLLKDSLDLGFLGSKTLSPSFIL